MLDGQGGEVSLTCQAVRGTDRDEASAQNVGVSVSGIGDRHAWLSIGWCRDALDRCICRENAL